MGPCQAPISEGNRSTTELVHSLVLYDVNRTFKRNVAPAPKFYGKNGKMGQIQGERMACPTGAAGNGPSAPEGASLTRETTSGEIDGAS